MLKDPQFHSPRNIDFIFIHVFFSLQVFFDVFCTETSEGYLLDYQDMVSHHTFSSSSLLWSLDENEVFTFQILQIYPRESLNQ